MSSWQHPPSIAVLIATRNRVAYLKTAIASAQLQTLRPKEIIVVDDGSTDETSAFLTAISADVPELKVICSPHCGVSAARNKGIAASKSELIAFLDDDDIWEPEKLELQAAFFTKERPRLGLVNCGFRQIDVTGSTFSGAKEVVPNQRGDIFLSLLQDFYPIAPSTLMCRRSSLMAVGGFDTTITLAEDREICLRLARAFEADYVPDVLVGHRQHPTSVYRQAMRREPEEVLFQRLEIWDKWLSEVRDPDKVRQRFRGEAIAAAVATIWFFPRMMTLYRRLRHSELRLANSLFDDHLDYLGELTAALGFWRNRRRSETALPTPLSSLKLALAERVIVPNPYLLKLAKMFGKFDGQHPRPRDSQE